MLLSGVASFIFAFVFYFSEAANFAGQDRVVLEISFMLLSVLIFLIFLSFFSFILWVMMKFEEGHRADIYRLLCAPGVLHPRQ
jgi:hypothetical protein